MGRLAVGPSEPEDRDVDGAVGIDAEKFEIDPDIAEPKAETGGEAALIVVTGVATTVAVDRVGVDIVGVDEVDEIPTVEMAEPTVDVAEVIDEIMVVGRDETVFGV